jgi:tetratricopeptide (TPR) repeat protein
MIPSEPLQQIDRARALHLRGEHAAAATLYRQIMEAHPDNADVRYRYANLLKDQGAFDDALTHYDAALARKSDHAHAYCNRAVVLGLLKRLPEALESYDHAIAIEPGDVIAHCNRAMVLIGLGQKDAALAGFKTAIAHEPNCFAAHFGCGALLQERQLWTEALAAYDRAIAVNPGDALTHFNRGCVLEALEQWHAALLGFERAIALHPEFALAYASRAALLQQLGRLKAALADYDRAVALNPASAKAWFNRGTVLTALDDLEASVQSYERAIALQADNAEAHLNRACTLQNMGLLPPAIEGYRQAIGINPELPEAHYNLALASLTIGDFATGWRELEWRWRAKGGPIYREKRTFGPPLWLGQEDIAGKTLLLYGEQGLGDSLQFCRYAEKVAQLGARVILEVPAPLVDLCARLPGVAMCIPYGSALPAFDWQCPLMSLPLAFATTLETIPSSAGYLKNDPNKVAVWQERLGAKSRLRIGLTWSGNQAPGTNRKRHFALSSLVPHLPAGFDYFCLQTEVLRADQQTLANAPVIRQFENLFHDFSDHAALCECMDLVVSVDTSVAHLSCGLGKRTWVLLAHVADWRWLLDREDSPWYASARLFRQDSPGDWQGVFERVAAEIQTVAF